MSATRPPTHPADGALTVHAPGRPAVSVAYDDRCQPAKPYWPIRRASVTFLAQTKQANRNADNTCNDVGKNYAERCNLTEREREGSFSVGGVYGSSRFKPCLSQTTFRMGSESLQNKKTVVHVTLHQILDILKECPARLS